MLALSSWPDVMEEHTLLTPPACRTLWRQFVSDSDLVVQQAVATQEANRAAGNRMPPVWALAAIVLLGWNEFMALVYSPLWLLLVGFIFFFGRVRGDMAWHGVLSLVWCTSHHLCDIDRQCTKSWTSTLRCSVGSYQVSWHCLPSCCRRCSVLPATRCKACSGLCRKRRTGMLTKRYAWWRHVQ